MVRNAIREITLWLIIAYFSESLSLNETSDVYVLEYPGPTKCILAGEKLELQWKYQVNMATKWRISLYEYNYTSATKTKLIMLLQSGITVTNPNYLDLAFRMFDMELSYDKARISVPTTKFRDYDGYGILFESTGANDDLRTHLERFTEINIIEANDVKDVPRSSGNANRPWFSFVLLIFIIHKL